MKLRRLLPGSVTHHNGVVDHRGTTYFIGPIFVPLAAMTPERKAFIGAAGWCVCPAKHWPSVLPARGLTCIAHRSFFARAH